PEDRFVTAGELVQALAVSHVREGAVVAAGSGPGASNLQTKVSKPELSRYWRRRPPALLGGVGLAALVATALGLLLVRIGGDGSTSPAVAAATLVPVAIASPTTAVGLATSPPASTPAASRAVALTVEPTLKPSVEPTRTPTSTAVRSPTPALADEWQRTQGA